MCTRRTWSTMCTKRTWSTMCTRRTWSTMCTSWTSRKLLTTSLKCSPALHGLMQCTICTVSQKGGNYILVQNVAKYWHIFKILSPADPVVN